MITPYTEFLERRERRQRVKDAFAQPGENRPAAETAMGTERPSVDNVSLGSAIAAERPLPNSHTDANGFRTLERAT